MSSYSHSKMLIVYCCRPGSSLGDGGGEVGCTFLMLVGDLSFVGDRISTVWAGGRVSSLEGLSKVYFGGDWIKREEEAFPGELW